MNDSFEIYEFRYVDRKTKQKAVIYAREEKTAARLILLWNSFQNIYHWEKKRFRFKVLYITTTEPYLLEKEQEECLLHWKEHALRNDKKE